MAKLALRVACRRSLRWPGEGERELGVDDNDTAYVVVELPDQSHIAAEASGDLGLMVLVDLIDEQPVLVQEALHLYQAPLELLHHSIIHLFSISKKSSIHFMLILSDTRN